MKYLSCLGLALIAIITFSTVAEAEGYLITDFEITLKDHAFSPDNTVVPANSPVKLTIKNLQDTPAEFESSDIGREKVVKAGKTITVNIGPLAPGTYTYFDDFNRATKATITAK